MVRRSEYFPTLVKLLNGIQNDKIYYVLLAGSLAANRIQLASTFNDALARRPLTGLSNGGGKLTVRSRVSDKNQETLDIQFSGITSIINGMSWVTQVKPLTKSIPALGNHWCRCYW